MRKRILASAIILILGLLLVTPVSAAPTLRQQVTYADGLVKMMEKANKSCGSLVTAAENQASGVTSTADSMDALTDYFSCAFAPMTSFYTEHWVPAAVLKSFQPKIIKLADNLSALSLSVVSSATSTDFLPFKTLLSKNETALAGLKKDMTAIKKKYPAAAKPDEAFLKKIAAKEKASEARGFLNVKTSCGKNTSCFDTKFTKCASAWIRYPVGKYDIEFKVTGKAKGGCKVQVAEVMDYLGLFAGKSMNCVLDNKKTLSEELARIKTQISDNGAAKVCSGALLDYLKKQQKVLKATSLDTLGLKSSGSAYSDLNGESGFNVSVKLDISDATVSSTVSQ